MNGLGSLGSQVVLVRGKCNINDFLGVLELAEHLIVAEVPQGRRPILAAGCQGFAVFREDGYPDRLRVSLEAADGSASRHVMKPDPTVITASQNDRAAVGCEHHGRNESRTLSFEIPKFLTGCDIPESPVGLIGRQ